MYSEMVLIFESTNIASQSALLTVLCYKTKDVTMGTWDVEKESKKKTSIMYNMVVGRMAQ